MKKIAIIFLLLFTAVQAAPAVISFFSSVSVSFLIDEEKCEDSYKTDPGNESKSLFPSQDPELVLCGHKCIDFGQKPESIIHPPFLEKVSPPPNFS